MNERERPSPVCETGDGMGGQFVMRGFVPSDRENTTKMGQAQAGIAALLLPGAAHAVPLRQLAAWTGLDEREVRRAIQRERLAGVPILADNVSGYFLPACEAERAGCVRSMRHRAGQILAAADAIAAGGNVG